MSDKPDRHSDFHKQAVILAGGKGSRLGEITSETPKPLLDVGGVPFIEHIILQLAAAGFTRILILAGPYIEKFESALGTGTRLGVEISYIDEPVPAGTGGALYHARGFLDQAFLYVNGDSFFETDVESLAHSSFHDGILIHLILRQVEDTGRYGRVELDGDKVTYFGEKETGDPGLINAGIYWVDRGILDVIDSKPCSIENDILPQLVKERRVTGTVRDGFFIDIGLPEDLERARAIFTNR